MAAIHKSAFYDRVHGKSEDESKTNTIEGKAPSIADLSRAFVGSAILMSLSLVIFVSEHFLAKVRKCHNSGMC